MQKLNRSQASANECCTLGPLPDDIVLEILNKLIDLKTLCVCKLVSKRFYLIILQVDTICYHADAAFQNLSSFWSLKSVLSGFKSVKSLCIKLPSTRNNNSFLFKWKISSGNKVDSYIYLSPNSVYDNKGLLLYDYEKLGVTIDYKAKMATLGLSDALMWRNTLFTYMVDFPLLEKVSVNSSNKNVRIFLSGGKVSDKTDKQKAFKYIKTQHYVDSLELPVSGYVMKRVTVVIWERDDLPNDGKYDSLMKSDDCKDDVEDKEEVVYNEAIVEILKKIQGQAAFV